MKFLRLLSTFSGLDHCKSPLCEFLHDRQVNAVGVVVLPFMGAVLLERFREIDDSWNIGTIGQPGASPKPSIRPLIRKLIGSGRGKRLTVPG